MPVEKNAGHNEIGYSLNDSEGYDFRIDLLLRSKFCIDRRNSPGRHSNSSPGTWSSKIDKGTNFAKNTSRNVALR